MKSNKPVIYLDSCCFIDVVKKKVNLLPADREDDVWYLKALMKAHKAGDVKLITSTLTIGECVAVESGQLIVPDHVQEHFKTLITSGQYVSLAPQTPRTGAMVQDIRWKQQIVLKGADCLHMATALEQGAIEFITMDDRLKKPRMIEAAAKLAGTIRCNRATGTLSLPDEYLQSGMEI